MCTCKYVYMGLFVPGNVMLCIGGLVHACTCTPTGNCRNPLAAGKPLLSFSLYIVHVHNYFTSTCTCTHVYAHLRTCIHMYAVIVCHRILKFLEKPKPQETTSRLASPVRAAIIASIISTGLLYPLPTLPHTLSLPSSLPPSFPPSPIL